LRVLEVRLVLKADQDVLRRAEFLYSEVAKTERREGLADFVDLECLRPAQFDDDTTAEIDPEIEAGVEEEHHRQGAQNRRPNEAGKTTTHELDICAVGN
jgi:hypothetical protein